MKKIRKIKVLVVDDSLVFREFLSKGIALDPSIEVIGIASDPFMARDKIIEFDPDVMTLDIEMPKMDGIEFLRKLMPQYPIPVVIVSGFEDRGVYALKAGAIDFAVKPNISSDEKWESFIKELIIKIKIASTANVSHWKSKNDKSKLNKSTKTKVIAIGASTGGTEAIHSILKNLSRDLPGIVIVQHMPPVFTKMFADRLNNLTLLEVKEAENGDMIYPGRVLIAPGEHHMKIKKRGNILFTECAKGEKMNGHCPSVDVLFQSVAKEVGKDAMGIILTGMGSDGARGLLSMKKEGAITIGQDEKSCVVYGMPKVAFEIGAVEKQIPLTQMPDYIYSRLNK